MTKQIYILAWFLVLCSQLALGQSTGVGVLTPAYPLDVAGRFRIRHQTGNSTAGFYMDGSQSAPLRSFIGVYNQDYFGVYGAGTGWSFLIHNNNQNVGVGGVFPDFRLDVSGRMRIQHNGNETAGIWFDGISQPTRSFIGNINDDYVGIWGSGGAGWSFAMNVTNGNTGIATTTPTAKLDVNGTIRLRSQAPMKGSQLTCNDANGNAEWQNPVVFRAEGLQNNAVQTIPLSTWTKVLFNVSPAYNISTAYQPTISVFEVPTNGIYEFISSVSFSSYANNAQSIRMILQRNGVISVLAQHYNKGIYRNTVQGYYSEPCMLSTQQSLMAGDQVWVEVWMYSFNGVPEGIQPSITSTWFSGQLVAKQ